MEKNKIDNIWWSKKSIRNIEIAKTQGTNSRVIEKKNK